MLIVSLNSSERKIICIIPVGVMSFAMTEIVVCKTLYRDNCQFCTIYYVNVDCEMLSDFSTEICHGFSVTWFVYGKSSENVNSMITEFIDATVIAK